ncbi:MAG TPA: XRE family transcriptional regulator [Streptosporangiaceae bacterium]|nr:XRE family transcriptional regulator [Streptosporangiaceae bacterium]
MNEVLRRALDEGRLRVDDLAEQVGVDPKTVRRWLAGRLPYRRHRLSVAQILGLDETDLWPQTIPQPPLNAEPPKAEIVAIYPHRWAVPRAVWLQHFARAQHEIGILAYAGLFLAEDTGILRLLADKASNGVTVRILLGDPESPRASERGADEGIGEAMAAKIRNSLILYQPLRDLEHVQIRLHDTVLYNSIYRADDDLLINPHAYGIAAAHSPVLHIRKTAPDDMATTYLNSFDRVWSRALST